MILSTNVLIAYNAGRYERQVENSAARPYLEYVSVLDGRTRPGHRALDGKVFVVDSLALRTIPPAERLQLPLPVEIEMRRAVRRNVDGTEHSFTPDGMPWAVLSEGTKERRTKRGT